MRGFEPEEARVGYARERIRQARVTRLAAAVELLSELGDTAGNADEDASLVGGERTFRTVVERDDADAVFARDHRRDERRPQRRDLRVVAPFLQIGACAVAFERRQVILADERALLQRGPA